MPSIYVDFDDVLCHTTEHFLSIMEREFGRKVPYDEVCDFDWTTWCGLSPSELAHLFAIAHQPEELLKIAPRKGAAGALKNWEAQGFRCVIVTGRPPDSIGPSLEWLDLNGMAHAGLVIVDKYGRYTGRADTMGLEELATKQFCLAIEDSLQMARFIASRMRVPVALINCPWNRESTGDDLIRRHSDWTSVCRGTLLQGG